MSELIRYIPEWPFPAYQFVPGTNPHPKKAGGHMEGEGDPVASPLNRNHPEESQFLRYALDLLNFGYFWESHVYFEALWNAHGRKGEIADFLKGMIKLGASGVKFQIGEVKHAEEHLTRAKELFLSLPVPEGMFLGFDLTDLIEGIDLSLKAHKFQIAIRPQWK